MRNENMCNRLKTNMKTTYPSLISEGGSYPILNCHPFVPIVDLAAKMRGGGGGGRDKSAYHIYCIIRCHILKGRWLLLTEVCCRRSSRCGFVAEHMLGMQWVLGFNPCSMDIKQ